MMEFHLQIHEYLKTLCIAPAEIEHLLQKEQLPRLVIEISALQNEDTDDADEHNSQLF